MRVSDAAAISARPQAVIQRAYVYAVALVAVHMLVLGVANLLRVLAEIALAAPSGGFTGLPFVFAEFNRPRDLYREQASLAIALLAVGAPAWWWHWRLAQRAAAIVEERASALRSLYVHAVVLVSALLVFGYGQRALRLVLQGLTFGSVDPRDRGYLGLEPDWQARAAGAAAMALAAGVVLAFHLGVSAADRGAGTIAPRAAAIRHLALYALVVIGLFFATFNAAGTLDGLWRRAADAVAPLSGLVAPNVVERPVPPGAPPDFVPKRVPSRDELLRFQLLGAVPAIVAGLALWLGSWVPLQRQARGGDDPAARASVIRKLAIYLVVLVSAVAVLVAATVALSDVGRRLLGDPVIEPYTSLWHELGSPVPFVFVFGAVWLFHRRVVESEAARETEAARAATIRRVYTYLISAIGLAMAAIGTAGTVGVLGSQLMGLNTHQHAETATYISLALVGATAFASHWRTALRRLDDDERRSLPRRAYLYLAVLAGVLGLLVFGSAALYRLLNAALGLSFGLDTWHDVGHFVVDSGVSAAVAVWSFRMLRADRASLGAMTAESYDGTLSVRASDRAAARERVASLIAGGTDLTLKG